MESASPPPSAPSPSGTFTKKNLENYAIAYIGAYMNTIAKERPDHLPVLARCHPVAIEVSLLPNNCFVMLFEKSDKQTVTVDKKDWAQIEERVMDGATHFVAVYAHEGVTVADAISRGKRDAIRDIRSVEDSAIAKAVGELEKIVAAISATLEENKDVLNIGEEQLAKLQPIREAIAAAGPKVDMLAMLDALRNYSTAAEAGGIESEERVVLEEVAKQLEDLSDVIQRVEAADQKLAALEESMKKTVSELNRAIDERINKGLAVILSSTDKKIDKGLTVIADTASKNISTDLPRDLEVRLERLEKVASMYEVERASPPPPALMRIPPELEERLAAVERALGEIKTHELKRPDLSGELVAAVADLRENIARINSRITKIEQFLVSVTVRQRVLKQK